MQELLKKWKELCKAEGSAGNNAESAKLDLRAAVAGHFEIDEFECVIGIHECKDSPIELCVYNEGVDPSLDNCLVCGAPYERY